MEKHIFFFLLIFLSFSLNKCIIVDEDDFADDEMTQDEFHEFGEYEYDGLEEDDCYDSDEEENVFSPSVPLVIDGRKMERTSTELNPFVAFIRHEPVSGVTESDRSVECQGTAVSNTLILTALTCVTLRNANELRVYLRANDHRDIYGQGFTVDKIFAPADKGDIALLQLKEKINLPGFSHIHLPRSDVRPRDILNIVGCGYPINPAFCQNDGLMSKVYIEVLPDSECFRLLGANLNGTFDAEYNFCARGAYDEKAVIARGDIGIGAFSSNIIYGVAANAFAKNPEDQTMIDIDKPSIFTRVHRYTDWIRQKKHTFVTKAFRDFMSVVNKDNARSR